MNGPDVWSRVGLEAERGPGSRGVGRSSASMPGAASAAARAHGGMWSDGPGGVLHGACVPVECRILAWLVTIGRCGGRPDL